MDNELMKLGQLVDRLNTGKKCYSVRIQICGVPDYQFVDEGTDTLLFSDTEYKVFYKMVWAIAMIKGSEERAN